jgi:hypothetical protein
MHQIVRNERSNWRHRKNRLSQQWKTLLLMRRVQVCI